jgi:hypothetical protein
MDHASCLSPLSNARLIWNTVNVSRIAGQLRAAGHFMRVKNLARVSPLARTHTIPSDTYFQSPHAVPTSRRNLSWPDQRRSRMPASERVNWQPISQMPLVASMIDSALNDTADRIQTLTEARARPHVLDDATIDQVERVHGEQLEFIDIFAEQLRRWRDEGPSAAQRQELDRLEEQNRHLRQITREAFSLAADLRKSTIDGIIAMSDLELGLQTLLIPPLPHRP